MAANTKRETTSLDTENSGKGLGFQLDKCHQYVEAYDACAHKHFKSKNCNVEIGDQIQGTYGMQPVASKLISLEREFIMLEWLSQSMHAAANDARQPTS